MPIVFSDRLQEDLAFLGSVPADVVAEFLNVCIDAVENGARKAMFARAATALGVTPEAVMGSVMGLTECFLLAAKNAASEHHFAAALTDLTLPESHRKLMVDFFVKHLDRLRAHLAKEESSHLPQYKALDWRLDVTVASRHCHDMMSPSFTLRLDTVAPAGDAAPAYVTADYAALRKVADALDEASAEMRTAHSKRVLRYIR